MIQHSLSYLKFDFQGNTSTSVNCFIREYKKGNRKIAILLGLFVFKSITKHVQNKITWYLLSINFIFSLGFLNKFANVPRFSVLSVTAFKHIQHFFYIKSPQFISLLYLFTRTLRQNKVNTVQQLKLKSLLFWKNEVLLKDE